MTSGLTVVVATDPGSVGGARRGPRTFEPLVRSALLYADRVHIANIGWAVAAPAERIHVNVTADRPRPKSKKTRTLSLRVEIALESPDYLEPWGLTPVGPKGSATSAELRKVLDDLRPALGAGLIIPIPANDDEAFFTDVISDELVKLNPSLSQDFVQRAFIQPIWLSGVLHALAEPAALCMLDPISARMIGTVEGRAGQGRTATEIAPQLAAAILAHLPSFSTAPIDELLDIRSELERPLVRFRAAIVRLSTDVGDLPEGDIPALAQELWIREVHPAVCEVEELTRENAYILRLLDKVATRDGLVSAAALAVSVTRFSGIAQAVTASAAAGAPFLSAARDKWLDSRKIARQHEMYFIAQTRRRLTR